MTLVENFHHLITDKEHVEHVEDLLDALLAYPSTHTKISNWACVTTKKTVILPRSSYHIQAYTYYLETLRHSHDN
jgi:hypothetical protein